MSSKPNNSKRVKAKERTCKGVAAKATSIVVAAALAGGTVGAAFAENGAGNDTESAQRVNESGSDAAKAGVTAVDKEETVYVKQNADGTARSTQVSAWLKNADKVAGLLDFTNLTNIENVEGEQDFTKGSGSLLWDADGSDIYYRGDTTEETPVQIKISYWLNGKQVADPSSLAGKSGKVKIRFDYENTSKRTEVVNGKNIEVTTPFVAVSGLMLNADKFSNVTAENAKVLSDGDRIIVAGAALPGLRESLQIDDKGDLDVDIPEYIEVECETTDFQLDGTLSYVSADFLDEVDEDDFSTDSLSDRLSEMQDGMAQLVDGGNSLKDGLGTLAGGASTLDAGIGQLQVQTSSLPASVAQLDSGAQTLSEKASEASDGAGKIAAGAQSVTAGLSLLRDGDGKASAGLVGAVGSIGDESTPGQTLLYGLARLKAGTSAIANGDGTPSNPGLMGLAGGAGQLSSGLSSAKSSLVGAADQLSAGADGAQAAANGASQKASGAAQYLSSIDTSSMSAEDRQKVATALALLTNGTDGAVELAGTAAGAAGQVSQGATSLRDTASSQLDGAVDGANSIQSGASDYAAALNGDVADGLGQVSDGLITLKAGLGSAASALGEGGQLYEGLQALASGSGNLSAGLSQLFFGSQTLASGTSQLNSATPALISGIGQIKDGSSQLVSGAQQAYDGSITLSDGLETFSQEAVQKIVDLYNGDVTDLVDRTKALVRAGKAYDNFSGKADGASGKVKFVYESAGVTSEG